MGTNSLYRATKLFITTMSRKRLKTVRKVL
jgi:hypothetical protein